MQFCTFLLPIFFSPPPTHKHTIPCKHIQNQTLSDSRNLGFHVDILPNCWYGSDDAMGREHRTGSLADEESSWQLSIRPAYPDTRTGGLITPCHRAATAQSTMCLSLTSPRHFLNVIKIIYPHSRIALFLKLYWLHDRGNGHFMKMSGLTCIAHGWSWCWGEATVWLFVGFSKVNYRLGLGHILFTRTWLSIFHPGRLNRSHLLLLLTVSRTHTYNVQGHMCTHTHLSLSLSESSSRIWTACLWYCSWDSTSDDSWLTCSICTGPHTH